MVAIHHVVEGFTQEGSNKNLVGMAIQTSDGEAYLVTEILSVYKDADLAIVRVDTRGKKLTALLTIRKYSKGRR